MRLSTISVALFGALVFVATEALGRPASTLNASDRRVIPDIPPRLDDTLAVAKSPLEPVTLAGSLPGARNDGNSLETTTAKGDLSEPGDNEQDQRLTTRSGDISDQQPSSSTSRNLDESKDSASDASTSPVPKEETEESTSSIEAATEAPLTETETKLSSENETEVTTPPPSTTTSTPTTTTLTTTTTTPKTSDVPASDERAEEAIKAEATTARAEPTATPTPEVSTSPPKSSENDDNTDEGSSPRTPDSIRVSSTEAATIEAVTTTTPEIVTSTEAATTKTSAIVASTEAATTNTPEIATSTKAATTTKPEIVASTAATETAAAIDYAESSSSRPGVPSLESTSEQTITTASSQPKVEDSTEIQSNQTPNSSSIATTITTTTSTDRLETTTPEPVASTSKPAAPVSSASENEQDKEDKSSCNHLPSYGADEIQKVFREETTFRNGSIKGKFTYINFDQRYRLVHYTRLPYGPVKIDRVEELGRPNQANSSDSNQASSQPSSDIPNAVLQLRNLLPNSLFGFPFFGSNPVRPAIGSDDYKSTMYFYSTDSLATPNLLSPRVPVSVPPTQHVKLQQADSNKPAIDVLDPSYREQLIEHQLANSRLFGMPMPSEQRAMVSSEITEKSRDYNQFHYSSPAGQSETRPYVYTYFGAPSQLSQYQYASMAPQTMQLGTQYQGQVPFASQVQTQPIASSLHHQAHQPHSHEHYMTQYMLTQPTQSSELQNDNVRLRLRVKTSKALDVNHENGRKSAQLRLQPSDGHFSAASIDSPARLMKQRTHQRQRLGKQNHQLKTAPSNQPVVYHVLRNPAGRVYSQYNPGYAVAYDHDN